MTVNCHTIHNSKSCSRYHFSWKRICALKTEISPSLAPSSPLRAFPISTMLSQRKERGVWVAGCDARFSLSFFRHEICQKKFTPPDFQANDFTPSISLNFNSFSDKNTKMSVFGEIYTTGKRFYTAGGSNGSNKSHL